MKRIVYLQLILVIFISALVGYYFGVNKVAFQWQNYKPVLNISSKEPPESVSNMDFANFWKVWQDIEVNYYDKSKLNPQKMLDGAISGMVSSLDDPFTVYLPPTQNNNFKQGLAGQFEGIGAELGLKGVRAGDMILAVNDESTDNWTISQAVEKIRGPKGSEVELTVVRDEKNKKDIKIVRDTITINSVEGYVKKAKDIEGVKIPKDISEKQVAYISLSQFGDNTNQDWLLMINKISLEMKNKKVEGVIFDLRNNPGGYLTDANFIAAEFLKEGTPVVIQEEGNGEKTTMKVNRKGLLLDVPLIVLINKGSASASEIVAGALRDHNRAKLYGEVSFGKGTIQQSEDLGNGAGLHVTIAKWLTPNETWVHGKGLTPDVEVKFDNNDPSHDAALEKAIIDLLK
ncbi:MAG: S41 family peptidase [Candidatus Levybacteria bacterium]|nr:S41 family peptidase [Candidatus Levybacteria bacterium]